MRGNAWILIACTGLAVTAIALAADDSTSAPSGEATYKADCAKCHSGGFGGFFSGAPKTGDEKAWKTLTPKGIDELTATTLTGVGKMPPRGGCDACSDAEIRAAVEYMLQQSE